jgi:SAM-dependent methyltransferase
MVPERQAMGALGGRPLLLMDSISSLHPEDAGCVVVSGSHGGASAGRLARGRGLAAAVFNDAGVGKDGAGVAALAMLEEDGTPAAAVGHLSARIGDARDAWEHGVVSHANGPARALGLAPGAPLAAALGAAFGAAPPPSPVMVDGAAELLRLRDGVYATDLLIAAVGWLDLFTWLVANPCDLDGLCSGLGLARRPAHVMCSLLAAMGLLESVEGTIRPSALAGEHLTTGRPGDLSAYLAVLRERPACRELLGVLRTDQPAAWASAGAGAEWAERLGEAAFADAFTAAMEGRAAVLAPALADALAGVPGSHVLDVAGGSGAYARALVERRDGLRATVLERPPVDRAARAHLRERGWAHRVDVVGADMFVDPLPAGPDLHLYSHVLHDWDEDAVSRLLAASFAALPSGGHVADHDAHLDPDRRGPLAVARYSALIVHSTSGRCYSSAEIAAMMVAAGFVEPSLRPTAADRSVVVARKPMTRRSR